jgi:hypothetical protein
MFGKCKPNFMWLFRRILIEIWNKTWNHTLNQAPNQICNHLSNQVWNRSLNPYLHFYLRFLIVVTTLVTVFLSLGFPTISLASSLEVLSTVTELPTNDLLVSPKYQNKMIAQFIRKRQEYSDPQNTEDPISSRKKNSSQESSSKQNSSEKEIKNSSSSKRSKRTSRSISSLERDETTVTSKKPELPGEESSSFYFLGPKIGLSSFHWMGSTNSASTPGAPNSKETSLISVFSNSLGLIQILRMTPSWELELDLSLLLSRLSYPQHLNQNSYRGMIGQGFQTQIKAHYVTKSREHFLSIHIGNLTHNIKEQGDLTVQNQVTLENPSLSFAGFGVGIRLKERIYITTTLSQYLSPLLQGGSLVDVSSCFLF